MTDFLVSMATKVIMPQGGQDLTEGKVLSWLKNEGDLVKQGDVLCEVETEKATFEVSAPGDGVLLKIITPAGEIAQVFSAIGVVGTPGEHFNFAELTGQPQADEGAAADQTELRPQPEEEPEGAPKRIKVSGRAKKVAKEKGVDLIHVRGTGPGGRIREDDIFAYLKQAEAQPVPLRPQPEGPPTPVQPQPIAIPTPQPEVRGKVALLSKMRKAIARRLQQSKQTIPHFYVTVSVEMTAALELREALNAQSGADSAAKISINDLVVKAAALALEEFYQVNCLFQEDNLVYLDQINIGIAVSLDDGLIVPVLSDVDILSLKGIAKKTKELVALAKSGKQTSSTQGAFTITNMGMMDVENFAAIINPPESAILAISSVQKGVVVSEHNDISIRDMMKMTISADHRVVDGVLAAKFINKIKYHLQNPKTLLT